MIDLVCEWEHGLVYREGGLCLFDGGLGRIRIPRAVADELGRLAALDTHQPPALHEARPGYVLCCCGDHVVPLAEEGSKYDGDDLVEVAQGTRQWVVNEVLEVLKSWGHEPGEHMVDAVADLAAGPRQRRKAARLSVSEIRYGETESERMYRLHPIRTRWENLKLTVSEWWHS